MLGFGFGLGWVLGLGLGLGLGRGKGRVRVRVRVRARARARARVTADLAQRRVGVGAAERLSWVGRRVAGEQGVALAHGHRGDLDACVDGWMEMRMDGW